jgi:hypothetical protein
MVQHVLYYLTGGDLAQSTSYQNISFESGSNDNDHHCSGYLHFLTHLQQLM